MLARLDESTLSRVSRSVEDPNSVDAPLPALPGWR